MQNNKTGIRFKDDTLIWKGLSIDVNIDYRNSYEAQALQDEICYCRIKRKFVRDRFKYYLQIVFKGTVPVKISKEGKVKKNIGVGCVGLDIGTQSIAIVSSDSAYLFELADRVQSIENQKRKLLRYLDRSKRATNAKNFNTDGTIKKGKRVWHKSNRYKKAQSALKELGSLTFQ